MWWLTTGPVVILLVAYVVLINGKTTELDIRIPGSSPQHMDTYLCVPYKVPDGDSYIVSYEPEANMDVIHHMFLHGCGEPYQKNGYWDCGSAPNCAGGKTQILYAWGKNAGPLKMPKDTGMHVGGSSGYHYFVLQLHYLHVDKFKNGHTDHSGVKITLENGPKKRLAGIYLVAGALTLQNSIPAHTKNFHMDAGCVYQNDGPTFHAFRFRVHTHKLGSVVTGYRVRNGVWTLIGKGDPQEPQAFNPTHRPDIDIKPGDSLMMRCTYNSTRDYRTYIGATHSDEMCNFYIMYYYEPKKGEGEIKYFPCETSMMTEMVQQLTMHYPDDTDIPLKKTHPSSGHYSSMGDAPQREDMGVADDGIQDNIEGFEEFVDNLLN